MPNEVMIPNNLILLVESGSNIHGLSLPGMSDQDLVGVYIEDAETVFRPKDPDTLAKSSMLRTAVGNEPSGPGDIDLNLYSLRKFLYLATAGNPSIMQTLFTPPQQVNSYGESLQDNTWYFVGRHLVPKYRGYMRAQGERLLGLRGQKRTGKARQELIEAHGWDTKFAMHCARLGFQGIELVKTGTLHLPIEEPTRSWLYGVRTGEVGFDEWWTTCLRLDEDLKALYDDDKIPAGPRVDLITEWSACAHRDWWLQQSYVIWRDA